MTEKIKITMLGDTHAGKTCYMLGMYATMSPGVKGFTLTTEDMDVDLGLREHWDQLVDTQDEKRWPEATAETTRYIFEFCYGLREILSFEWIDYRGGTLSVRSTDPLQETEELKAFLKDSTCVFLCVSGEHLVNSIKGNEFGVSRATGADRMIKFLRDLQKKLPAQAEKPAIVIVITKWDLVSRKKEEIITDIKTLFSPLFVANSGWFTMICPVTLGRELGKNLDRGAINPEKVHLPVTFSIYYALKNRVKNIRDHQQTTSDWLDEKRGFWADLLRARERREKYAAVTQYGAEIESLDSDMNLLMKELMENVTAYYEGREVELDI